MQVYRNKEINMKITKIKQQKIYTIRRKLLRKYIGIVYKKSKQDTVIEAYRS